MNNEHYLIIGVMSGTSLDGVDLVYVDFFKDESKWQYEIISAETVSYKSEWKSILSEAAHYSQEKLQQLNQEYTRLLADIIQGFIRRNNICDLTAVSSHGHTILHQPKKGFTLQIGNLPELAELLNVQVVCDFRVQDVQLGGQGAPLVPIGDQLLFAEFDYCLNLGGFANISTEINQQRIAFDICPVNTVLNHYANQLGLDYDEGGKIAAVSSIDHKVLNQLNSLHFYQQKPPKSLGIEWVHEQVFPLLKKSNISAENSIATFTAHAADQITRSLQKSGSNKILVTGGGAYNEFLMDSIQKQTEATLVIPQKNLIEYKEALIFGLLGVLRLRGENNILQSVTGASKDHCSGEIYHPTKM